MPNLFLTDDSTKYLIAQGFLDAAGGPKMRVVAKAADYTITSAVDASGTVFTNRGAAGAVIFTLPAAAAALAGVFYDFVGVVAAQNINVKTPVADTLVAFNDLTADSIELSTAGNLIGGWIRLICDGVVWIGVNVGVHTGTVNT